MINKSTKNEDDRIRFANVGQKLVSQAFTCARTFDETTDVDKLHAGRNHRLGLAHDCELFKPIVGDFGHSDIGVLCGEGIRGGEGPPTSERVIQRGLPRVWQSDESELFHGRGRLVVPSAADDMT